MEQYALIIFVKNPQLGKVKTRLAQDAGELKALEIYHQLIDHTLTVTQHWKGGDRYVFYSSYIDSDDQWPSAQFHKRLQGTGDLGDKMAQAFAEILGAYSQVAIIGSDCYQLRTAHIERAFQQLQTKDIVLGPSLDGGYYLLGMKSFHSQLFKNIPWSTDQVTPMTVQKVEELGLTIHFLESLKDIDYYQDWLEQTDSQIS